MVQTNYNPKALKNVKVTFRLKDQENRWVVTEEERALAEKCKHPVDLRQFTKEVRFLLHSAGSWLSNMMVSCRGNWARALNVLRKIICISTAHGSKGVFLFLDICFIKVSILIVRRVYRMNDKFGDLSFLVATNMPVELKTTLFPKLEMIYPNALKVVDTALEGQQNSFPSAHYSFWFKYGRRVYLFSFSHKAQLICDLNFQGDDTPSYADPSTLQEKGKQRCNTSQNIPRASLELKENSYEYQMFIEALGPLFLWINQLVL
jgi:hypothetical protein